MLSMLSCNPPLYCAPEFLPGLVEAWTSPQAEFGLLPEIKSLWWGLRPSESRLRRAGHKHCSTSRPRDGFTLLSPDRAWKGEEERRKESGKIEDAREGRGDEEGINRGGERERGEIEEKRGEK